MNGAAAESILAVEDVTMRFAGLVAVDKVSFDVRKGDMVSIIGPNGAGKTTLFNVLTGQLDATAGTVRFRGRDITRLKPHQRARVGMGRTFQIAKPLMALNVLENVMVGAFVHHRSTRRAYDLAVHVLEETRLIAFAKRPTSELTLSQRRRLEVARALALRPDIILLDEVMAGLNASEIAESIALFKDLHSRGMTILVIEHNLKAVRELSQRVIVLDHGALIAEGGADDILSAPAVVEAYLGRRREWKPS